jgi:hypothetical protein
MPVTHAIIDVAATQGGCILRRQILDLGMSPSAIDRLLRATDITPVVQGVYRVLPSSGWRSDLQAALAAIPGSVASHQTAAILHDVPRIRDHKTTVTAHSRTTHFFPLVTVRRSHDLLPEHITDVDGFAATTLPRTVVDLAAVLGREHLDDIVEDLVLAKRLDLGDVESVISQVARRGKPGVGSIRRVLEDRGTEKMPMSRLEKLGLSIVQGLSIPAPVREYPIPWASIRRFDLAWPEARLAVEWDSRTWHGGLRQMEEDRARDRLAIANGWVILRFTWDEVKKRPRNVGQQITSIVRSRLSG